MEWFLKQYTRAALGVALAALLLAGCAGRQAGQSTPAAPASESVPQADGSAVEKLLNGEHTLTELPWGTSNNKGLYEFVVVNDETVLCYTDYSTGVRSPLCDVEGCTHTDEKCPAHTTLYNNDVALAGDWVLTSGRDTDGTFSLDVRRLDGSEKRNLFSGLDDISFRPRGIAMEGDKVWLVIKNRAMLLDLVTGEIEEGAELPELPEDAGITSYVLGSSVLITTVDNRELLEEYYEPTGDSEADMRQAEEILTKMTISMFAWDPRTGEEVPLVSLSNGEWWPLCVWNNKAILFNRAQKRFESWDFITGETAVLAENWPEDQEIGIEYLWDDHLMLETTWKVEPDNADTWKRCLFALDLESGQMTEITLRTRGGGGTGLPYIEGESDDQFYVISHGPDDEYPREEKAMISKADYYAGVDYMQPIKDVF